MIQIENRTVLNGGVAVVWCSLDPAADVKLDLFRLKQHKAEPE